MRFILVVILATLAVCVTAQRRNVLILGVQNQPQAQFQSVFTTNQDYKLRNDEGRYVHDHTGKYYHKNKDPNAGHYFHDDSGRYQHDHSGKYTGTVDPYAGGFGKYAGQNVADRNSGKYTPPKKAVIVNKAANLASGNEIGAATSGDSVRVVSAIKPAATTTRRYFDEGGWRIIRQEGTIDSDGYHYLYETENGINAEEEGHIVNRGTDQEGMKANGFFSYTGPDDMLYKVTYTADADGFRPEGAHLHPIPPLILKSLEYKRSLGLI